ncbi:hypothetical protein DRO91_08760 [Candidatus Heimdallarchaeota archaeon]|nr:MAG: hypothetical protein DRO91_08760 [Candidatus Heimdallarchaeota archaeon]
MNIKNMVTGFLSAKGYSGLYNLEMECGCAIEDLMPCESMSGDCKAGYKRFCKGCKDIDYDFCEMIEWCIAPKKPDAEK